jgi:hypothetical protein
MIRSYERLPTAARLGKTASECVLYLKGMRNVTDVITVVLFGKPTLDRLP